MQRGRSTLTEEQRAELRRRDDEARRAMYERLAIVVALQLTILLAVLGRYLAD